MLMAARDGETSARRRRDRQLCACRRHGRHAVRMELAAALHHSAQPAGPVVGGPREEEVHETNTAPRRQKKPPPGTRPAPLAEAAEPQGGAATVGYVAPVPLLVVPTLHGEDGVEGTTVSFLLAENLEEKEKERERTHAVNRWPCTSLNWSSVGKRRKRK